MRSLRHSLTRVTCALSASALLAVTNFSYGQSFDDTWDSAWEEAEETSPWAWLNGFVEQTAGVRTGNSDVNKDISLMDSRVRLEANGEWQRLIFSGKVDLYYDGVLGDFREQIREASAERSFRVFDIKAGRQVLTWGTGDFLFLNDFFPKDWQSFFAGRDDEYLKSPTNAIKVSHYTPIVNFNLVWVPEFTPDNYINGDYFSFYDRTSEQIVAPGLYADAPKGDEWALRMYRNIGVHELALYVHDGYFKSPNAVNNNGQATFSRLQSLGASWRRPLGKGLFNAEAAYYHSADDTKGTNPAVSNSQTRFLLGYEQELVTRLTGSLQLYLENTLDYQALIKNSPQPALEPEEYRTLITTRVTWRSANEKLTLGTFWFYSPSDNDAYVRATAKWRLSDQWQTNVGINWFTGEQPHTFFGQFEDNSNVYWRIRYSF